ncbi:uncharacterized protein [Watersipora subatra]|uniref:uncharacterized protein isoform X2 n=1 Tax=Watersipora subatra TaxID=2589382 RepID=UPI00355C5F0D
MPGRLHLHLSASLGLFYLLAACRNAIAQDVTIAAKHTSGQAVDRGRIKESEDMRLLCGFREQPIYCAIKVFNESANAWSPQIVCVSRVISNEHEPDDEIIFSKQDAVCTAEMFEVTFTITTNSPTRYQCSARFIGGGGSDVFAEYPLHIYTVPTAEIEQSPASPVMPEGTLVNYTCQSTARPPPKLHFEYNNKVVRDGIYHEPDPSSISIDNSSATSTLIWSTTADAEMNGEDLQCVVEDHPAYVREVIGQHVMSVYFGPYNTGNRTVDWNTADGDYELKCEFAFNGPVEYAWYDTSEQADVPIVAIASGEKYVLKEVNFPGIKPNEPLKKEFVCEGTNTAIGNQLARMWFSVTITAQTTTKPANPGPVRPSSLEAYEIALIVVAIVVLVGIVLIAVAVIYRQRHTPAARKKQAARESRNSRYINESGTNGGSMNTQPDIIQNSYTAPDVPRSPVTQGYDNRYSQHPEDYADALDDKPRSRRPVAYSMDCLNDSLDAPSDMVLGGPPAYHAHDAYQNYSSHPDYSSYGAAC